MLNICCFSISNARESATFLRFTALKMSFAPVVGENEPLKDVMEALMDIFPTVFWHFIDFTINGIIA